MTVNYSFDLEDDDFFTDTFQSIPESDLLTHSTLSGAHTNHTPNNPTKNSNYKEFYELTESSQDIKITGSSERDFHSDGIKTKELHENPKVKFKENTHGAKENSSKTSMINSRFVPGFTPKAKKQKFPGPAGVFSEQQKVRFSFNPNDTIPDKHIEAEIEIQNITSSQFSADDLLLPSWQNLQSEVSSCGSLLSSAKYYSIQRVFHETSKKMPPKHIIVPVLCVLIKKFNPTDSTLVFVDDTGEICGKINKNVLDIYKEYIKDGTALILKKVTFLCNVLLLKEQSVVSVYLKDGSVRHFQDLKATLDEEEPLKPMSCGCTGTPKKRLSRNEFLPEICNDSPAILAKFLSSKEINRTSKTHLVPGPSSHQNLSKSSVARLPLLSSSSKETVTNVKISNLVSSSERFTFGSNNLSFTAKHKPPESANGGPCTTTSVDCKTKDSMKNLTSKVSNTEFESCNVSETINQVSSCAMKSSETKANLEAETLCAEFEMDDFDELLGSLDEKSFLDTI